MEEHLMATTADALKARLAHVQRELADVSNALGELGVPTADQAAAVPDARSDDALALAGIKVIDFSGMRELIDRVFTEMGIDVTEPAPSAQEVQQQMLREGVRPEDCILSRGIIEARDD
jgi:hypothetical protein